jgi:DNA-binding transcriptional MerR regulator
VTGIMVEKSPNAFRTISEVAEIIDVPAHVLRFWESKFSQIKPVKRGGGRRYYRPNDINLIRGIRDLLYSDGLTIKGAQKVLRERGVKEIIFAGEAALAGGAPTSSDHDFDEDVAQEEKRDTPMDQIDAPIADRTYDDPMGLKSEEIAAPSLQRGAAEPAEPLVQKDIAPKSPDLFDGIATHDAPAPQAPATSVVSDRRDSRASELRDLYARLQNLRSRMMSG